MRAADHFGVADSRFLAAALLLCAAAALWLLLSPTAFKCRAMRRRVAELEGEKYREWLYNVSLERWRDGLEGDPSVIEHEARKLGYGRPGERVLALALDPLPASRSFDRRAGDASPRFSWISAVRRSIAPALMLVIGGLVAVLFFTDLRVEDPDEPVGRSESAPTEPS